MKGQIDKKTIILIVAVAIIGLLVVTTPGWREIFGLGGINFSDQLLLYGAIAAGIIGMIIFVMNAK